MNWPWADVCETNAMVMVTLLDTVDTVDATVPPFHGAYVGSIKISFAVPFFRKDMFWLTGSKPSRTLLL